MIRQQVKDRIAALVQKLQELDAQWDRIDSTGRAQEQEELACRMGEISMEISELEAFINLKDWK